jgi:hypothetical protein
MDDIVEKIKSTVRIEQVIEQDGYRLIKRGRYWPCDQHDSLVVDVANQAYHWNSQGEHGDVINWVQTRRGYDFKSAVEDLCRRVGISAPDWGKQDNQVRLTIRAREEAFDVAGRVMSTWLAEKPEALEYAKGRGWTEAVIRQHHLGYSGSGSDEEKKQLSGELSLAGVDLKSPAAIAILGLQGGVEKWATAQGLNLSSYSSWIDNDRIPGVFGQRSLVYLHYRAGKVKYMSLRSIGPEKRHYNIPEILGGERQPFFNSAWSPAAESVVLVEGQADAISLGQWEIPAVALAGTHLSPELVSFIAGRKKPGAKEADREVTIYLGMDSDPAGQKNTWINAKLLGPMTRMVRWPGDEVKDANDLLKRFIKEGLDQDQQVKALINLMDKSRTFVEEICEKAGMAEGAARDEALKDAFDIVVLMPDFERATYQGDLSRLMKINQREFGRIVKTRLNENTKSERTSNTTFTLGGVIDGWLVEYMFDPEGDSSSLAWRNPSGEIGEGRTVEIKGTVYEAFPPTDTFRNGGVLFPSKLGELKSTRELVAIVELFIKRAYLLNRDLDAKIMAYYALLTWLYDCFNTIPYLRAMGEAGAGKSELMRRVGLVCYRLMVANGAGTAASLFRSVERYRGTVFIDEADLQKSDASNDIVKFLNLGAMKHNPIWRLEEVIIDGKKDFQERMYTTFCPKLIAMRRDFWDDAVGSRSLTFKIQPRETFELLKYKIPLEVNNDMRARALALRNLLLRWRLEQWQSEIPVDPTYYDIDISSRLNQVTGPLMAVAKDDPELQKEMRQFLREYYAEMVQLKSMTINARVIEAIWQIHKFPDLHHDFISLSADGQEQMTVGSITLIANQIIDQMNLRDPDDDDSKSSKKKKDELSPQKIGHLIREDLQLQVSGRTRNGYYVVWEEDRMTALAKRYGLSLDEIGPINPVKKEEKTFKKPLQPGLPEEA